jgi:peptide-methionine (S)-S-oxide reductase
MPAQISSLKSPARRRLLALCVGATLALGAGAISAQPRLETAVFSGGCFWTMEHGLEAIPGVVRAVSGYAGGNVAHPTYEQVNTETTGHLESVQVTYDPAKITYAQLVDRYWRLIDPTDDGGQACDRAPSYHSAILVSSPAQKQIVERSEAALLAGPLRGKHITTFVRPVTQFWPAEEYHQHFADRNPVRYAAYRVGCGRDTILKALWGGR